VAAQADDERPLSGIYVERLLTVEEVTAQVLSAAPDDSTAEPTAAETVEEAQQAAAPSDHRVDVVREAGGRRYVAYTYRRHDDVRLVFLPHQEVTAYGQASGMGTYPQHAWDVTALRIYEDGAPLNTPGHVQVHEQGTRPGDAVATAGHPPTLPRAESAAQHAFRRDVTLPMQQGALAALTRHLQAYLDTTVAEADRWRDRLALRRAQRGRVGAQLDALRSDYVRARLRARDDQLRARDTAAAAVLDTLAALQAEKRTYAERDRAGAALLQGEAQSTTLVRARIVQQARREGRAPSAAALAAVPDQPEAVDAALLRRQLRRLPVRADDPPILAPDTAAAVVDQSVLSSAEAVRARLADEALTDDDPALHLAGVLHEQYASFQTDWARLQDRERRLTARLARQRIQGEQRPVALPRARALRFSDGRIQAYSYNGTVAPSVTTFYGLYGSKAAEATTALPAPWKTPADAFDRATPLVTVASTDLPGTYGGPLLNSDLHLVGVQFDTNVQGAAGSYLFLPERMRTVSVDIRGILEGLSHVYGADRLVQELTSPSSAAK
jgi:hypothetical protein